MAVLQRLLLIISSIPLLAWADGPTSIFINQVPEYSLLESCAEIQVSTIVRDMMYACGDGSKLTSYACFCYQSSARVSSMIGKHVSTACNPQFPAQNTSAIEVFSSYCKLGAVAPNPTGTSSSSSSQTASASPASGPASDLASATGSPNTGSSSEKKRTNTVAIACGVAIPVGVIAIAAAAFLLWRRRRNMASSDPIELAGGEGHETQEADAVPEVYELKNSRWSQPPVEMDNNAVTPEMGINEKRDEKTGRI